MSNSEAVTDCIKFHFNSANIKIRKKPLFYQKLQTHCNTPKLTSICFKNHFSLKFNLQKKNKGERERDMIDNQSTANNPARVNNVFTFMMKIKADVPESYRTLREFQHSYCR